MNQNKTKYVGIAVIIIMTVISYFPIFQADFVGFDDPEYVTQNDWVKAGLTWEGVKWAFTTVYSANWHPLTWLSHMLDCEIYGMNASGHHISNVLLHIANSVLLFLIFFQITQEFYKCLAMGVLFAMHPLHIESVAWVAERKDVLSTFFGLWCILAYYRYIQRFEKKYYYLMIVGLCLSLMSKSMLVTMPFLLIILDVWPLKRTDNMRFKDKWPLFIPVMISCMITCFAQFKGQSINSLSVVSISDRVLNAFISSVTYIYKTIWPHKLSFLYPYPEQLNVWLAFLCLIVLVVICMVGIRVFSNMPFLLTGFMWFLVSLIPVIGIVQIGTQSMADRYTYVPHIGLFWAIIWSISHLFNKKRHHQVLVFVLCFVIIGLGCKTYSQIQYWKNGETLFRQAIKHTKNNYIAHNNLGACLTNPMESLKHFNQSIQINPGYIIGHINKGNCLFSMGKIKEAALVYQSILKNAPYHTQANMALAELYYHQNQLKQALQCYHHALKNADNCFPIYYRIAQIFQESGKWIEAQYFYSHALQLNPLSSETHYAYGTLLISRNQIKKAISHVKRALELDPDDTKAHNSLSELYARNGQMDKAFYHISIARKLAPENSTILKNFQTIQNKRKNNHADTTNK
jgi:tetratricopeptide (TPR) repeat protein